MTPEKSLILQQTAERITLEIIRQLGYKPECSEGCADCCYQTIPVHETELEIITLAHHYLSKRLRRCVEKRARSNRAQYKRYGLLHTSIDQIRRPSYTRRLGQARIRCPFLLRNRCLIYKDRPVACRTHFVVGGAENCRVGSSGKTQLVDTKELKMAYQAVRGGGWNYSLGHWLSFGLDRAKMEFIDRDFGETFEGLDRGVAFFARKLREAIE